MKFGTRKDDTGRPTYRTGPGSARPTPAAATTFSARLEGATPNARITLREVAGEWRREMRALEAYVGAGDLSVEIRPDDNEEGAIVLTAIIEAVTKEGHVFLREVEGGKKRERALRALAPHSGEDGILVTLRRLT